MGTWSYRCPDCGKIEDRSHYTWEGAHPIEWCTCDPEHQSRTGMERQPSAPNFTVKGYNAKNGYSKS